jgi:hypothetical protein
VPRRGAKAPSTGDELTGGSVTVVAGSIRSQDDDDALSVKLSIWDTEITMRADGAELGNWEVADVNIRPIDAFSFEFTAEGDRLIFTPDDPTAFAANSLVSGRGGGRKSRKAKRKAAEPRPAPVDQGSAPAATKRREKRRAKDIAQPSKPSRRERKAAEKASAEREPAQSNSGPPMSPPSPPTSAVRTEAVPSPVRNVQIGSGRITDSTTVAAEESPGIRIPAFREPVELQVSAEPLGVGEPGELPVRAEPLGVREPGELPVSTEPAGVPEPQPELVELPEKPRRRKMTRLKRAAPEERAGPETPEEMSEEDNEKPNRLWIRALDTARKYDFLGLDRVPVNESLRGQEHQHTWDHRVAPSSGPGRYICTICGEIRRP